MDIWIIYTTKLDGSDPRPMVHPPMTEEHNLSDMINAVCPNSKMEDRGYCKILQNPAYKGMLFIFQKISVPVPDKLLPVPAETDPNSGGVRPR